MKRVVGGVVAAAAIVVLLVGVPIALIQVGHYPTLRGWPTWQQIQATFLVPDDGKLILVVFTLLAWAAWLYLAAGFFVELIARLRHVPSPRLPGFALPQLAARTLIGAVILLFAGMTIHPAPAAADPLPANPHTSHAAPARVVTPQAPHEAEREQGSRYTVKEGDTLAEIAQKHLGDADRWPDIYQASKHLRMPDGHRFTDPDLIQAGQHLIIPTTTTKSTSHRYTVKDGDTLAEIAQKHLGDADRWPEIYQASKHLRMPDGHRFSDPDLIQPGQQLIIPGPAATKPTKPTKASRSTSVPNTDQQRVPVVPPVVATSPTPAPTTADTAPHVTDATVQDQAPVWSTSLGVGTILAGGVIGLVAWRRRLQHRRGPIGGHVPLPTDGDALAEQQLRAATDPLAIETVDQALRGLARDCTATGQPLPIIRAARLTADQFEVYLDEPTTLPAPWTGTADAAVWRFEADHQPDLDTEDLHTIPAPYPSLVTIGKDTEDETGLIFLDLEYLGSLGLTGARELTRQAVAALAIELASSPWADDLTVTIVGDYADLEGTLRSGRIVYVPTLEKLLDRLEARAATDRDALAAAVAELATARVTGAAPDATFPEIVLVASPLTTRQRGRLTRLVTTLPRVAIAAVTTDDDPIGDWHLTINGPAAGMLQPIGLAVTPQMITPDTYDRILSVIHIATHEEATLDEPTEPAAHDVDEGGLDLPETLVDQAETAAAQPATTIDDPSHERVPAAVEPEPTAHDDAGETSEAAGSTDLPSEDSVMPVPDLSQDVAEVVEVDQADFQSAQGDPVVADDEVVDEDPTAVSAEVLAAPALEVVEPEPELPPPYVRVLGPTPQLENARGEADMNGRRDVSLEAIVYMALHPGATGPSLDVALWPDSTNPASTRAPALSRARRWLGTDPDGNPYLASHTYRLSKAVTTDWAEFQQLTRAGVDKTSTSGLERALELVQGRPFGGVRTQSRNPRYTWAEPARQRMIEAITTVSYELAQRRWLRSDWIGVEAALARGIQVEPALEHLWRLRIRAAVKRGDAGIVQESITRMTHLAAKLGVEIDPETEELLKAVRHTRLLEEARS